MKKEKKQNNIPEEPTILSLFQKIKTKEIQPKIYSLLLQNLNHLFLYQGMDYSEEDARIEAIHEATKQNPLISPGWRQILGVYTSMEQLKDKLIQCNIEITNKTEQDKNELMKKIINNKDRTLFTQNKTKFNENEIKLLLEALKK